MRLAFMGTPGFAVPTLRALSAAGHEILAVYTQPPRRAGRGKSVRPSHVHQVADELGLPVATPESFKDPSTVLGFEAIELDAAIVVAYGQILPQAALDAPRLGCLNLHASLLPRWRGAAPIQRAIMAGDSETGAAVMQMESGLDTGDILAEIRTPIGLEDTSATLHDRLAEMGAQLMVKTLERLDSGTVQARAQSTEGITYATKIDKAEARLDWIRPGALLDCQIRGLSPFPGAWCEIAGERVKVLLSRHEPYMRGDPGQACDDQLLIGTGDGAVRLITLQRAGKGPVSASDFLNGTPVPIGTMLG